MDACLLFTMVKLALIPSSSPSHAQPIKYIFLILSFMWWDFLKIIRTIMNVKILVDRFACDMYPFSLDIALPLVACPYFSALCDFCFFCYLLQYTIFPLIFILACYQIIIYLHSKVLWPKFPIMLHLNHPGTKLIRSSYTGNFWVELE